MWREREESAKICSRLTCKLNTKKKQKVKLSEEECCCDDKSVIQVFSVDSSSLKYWQSADCMGPAFYRFHFYFGCVLQLIEIITHSSNKILLWCVETYKNDVSLHNQIHESLFCFGRHESLLIWVEWVQCLHFIHAYMLNKTLFWSIVWITQFHILGVASDL